MKEKEDKKRKGARTSTNHADKWSEWKGNGGGGELLDSEECAEKIDTYFDDAY